MFLRIALTGSAQFTYPQNYFDSPLHQPIKLAGNFGEIRPNHFHAGFDIRTSKEGMPVYAVADGYVSRIKISSVGYGKALYITHPNGYVSVYGHLQRFDAAILAKATALQNQLQSFEIDTLLLPTEQIPVKKGDLIGLSGNTGSSQAPHLHFEIRNEITEMPINPYYFGYQVLDNLKPTIVSIALYPMNSAASINGRNRIKKILPRKINGTYFIQEADSITLNGEIGFGINCYDQENEGSGTNNVFSIELLSGGKRIYCYEMESFSFDNARYVNAHIDYAEKQRSHQTIQKCFLAKNNLLEIYKGVINRGVIDFKDDQDHWITFVIKDFAGNKTELALKVKSTSQSPLSHSPIQKDSIYKCDVANDIGGAEFQAFFPPLTLYDDHTLNYKVEPFARLNGFYTPIYAIEDETVVLQKAMILKMYVQGIPPGLYKKLCIVSLDKNGKQSYEGGSFLTDFVFAETKHLGKFGVTTDVEPPVIRPFITVPKNNSIADFSKLTSLKFKVTDNLSGIKKYRGTIDGNWVICEYDPKNDLLFYAFDDTVKTGTHQFKLEVADDRDNLKVFEITFKR